MEHKRAKFLINKSGLEEADKTFLLTHLDMMEATVNTLVTESLVQKDVIDYNNALNNRILAIKEYIAGMIDKDEKNLEDINIIEGKLDNILKRLDNE